MTTVKNQSGNKGVKISTDATGTVRAMYVQYYQNEEQVLQSKSFTSINNAQKWANKILN